MCLTQPNRRAHGGLQFLRGYTSYRAGENLTLAIRMEYFSAYVDKVGCVCVLLPTVLHGTAWYYIVLQCVCGQGGLCVCVLLPTIMHGTAWYFSAYAGKVGCTWRCVCMVMRDLVLRVLLILCTMCW